ncbi:5-oxoprolinase subunit B family protein [Pseudactinotalea suaedae]|uniref:5-oxoprolinase subunit B family protein n=1 Tax=Pseudactinotalea suaedae TaxID=1524924 RepID=UPI0012E12316|nr:allophanate hydrolase subunit 1 [Pseudactinotalea suaedae]
MTRVLPSGERAALIEVDDAAAAHALAGHLREHASGIAEEIVPGARTVLVVARDPGLLPAVLEVVDSAPAGAAATAPAAEVVIEVDYDGADLADVARLTGLSVHEVVRRHCGARYVVEFVGFAPGFAYLAGLDPVLHVPRLGSPRPSLPAGSVAIAGPYAAVYPRSSPGGWRLLGHTDAVLFDPDAEPLTPLVAGTVVRFEPR